MKSQLALQKKFICKMCEDKSNIDFDLNAENPCSISTDLNLTSIFPILNSIDALTQCKITKDKFVKSNNLQLIKETKKMISLGSEPSILAEGNADFILSIYFNSQEIFKSDQQFNVNSFIMAKNHSKLRNLSSQDDNKDKLSIAKYVSEKFNENERQLDKTTKKGGIVLTPKKTKKKVACDSKKFKMQQNEIALLRAKEKCARMKRKQEALKASNMAKERKKKQLELAKKKAKIAERIRKAKLKALRDKERRAKEKIIRERRKRDAERKKREEAARRRREQLKRKAQEDERKKRLELEKKREEDRKRAERQKKQRLAREKAIREAEKKKK